MSKVQRLTAYHGVHPSGWKWRAPYSLREGEDIVWSAWRHAAAGNAAGED